MIVCNSLVTLASLLLRFWLLQSKLTVFMEVLYGLHNHAYALLGWLHCRCTGGSAFQARYQVAPQGVGSGVDCCNRNS